jgi:hypothetical protein
MGRHALRAPRPRLSVSLFVLVVGVVSCGRIGFDEKLDQDASLADAHPLDASIREAADDVSVASDDEPDVSVASDGGPDVSVASDGGPDASVASDDGPASADVSPGEDGQPGCSPSCVNPNGTTSCVGGTCVPVCATGFADCDGDPANGCETSTTTTTHCGTCGNVCASDAGTPACNSGTCGVSCDLTGTWAGKLSLQVTWPSSLTLAAGSGTLGFWVIVKGTQSGNTIPVTMVPCEITIPDFQSSAAGGNEPYGLTFPNSLFDHTPSSYLPTTSATVALGGTSPGSTYSVPAVAFLVGLSMTNPTTDAWPSTPEMVTQVDMDEDTKPGVTAPYKSGAPYDFVPVNLSKSARSDEAYLASRLAASFSGTISAGCTSISGTATVTHFDTHIVGCELSGGAGDCAQADSDFTDSNKPAYAAGSATLSLVKIPDAGTCADVRAAL